MKDFFLDRPAVKKRLSAQARKGLGRAGGKVRLTAQRSMRYVQSEELQLQKVAAGKRKRVRLSQASPAGSPPHAVQPHPLIRKFLFYALDPTTGTLVVGPERLPRGTGAPAVHEHGGTVRTRKKNPRRTLRRVGDGGEVRVDGKPTNKTKLNTDGRLVNYCRLRTGAQAERANRLNAELYGPFMIAETKTYPPRPFMQPALEQVAHEVPGMIAEA
jgi:hypothetical protein